MQNTAPTIKGCTIRNSGQAAHGLWLQDSSARIEGNTIDGVKSAGIYVAQDGSTPTIINNTLKNNQTGILTWAGGTYTGNTFLGNTVAGMTNNSGAVLDATLCNWGHPSGPLDDSDDRASGGWYNPDGLGDKVSDRVRYEPWSGFPQGDVNHDGEVDLMDTILVLQVMSGLEPTGPVFLDADVNGDGRIGVEEAIHNLGKVAE